jgi:hypothetical protein
VGQVKGLPGEEAVANLPHEGKGKMSFFSEM